MDNLPQVERGIMKSLFWSVTPILSSVHKRDPKVLGAIQTARNSIRKFYPAFASNYFTILNECIGKALGELNEYMRTYDQYKQFLVLETNGYT